MIKDQLKIFRRSKVLTILYELQKAQRAGFRARRSDFRSRYFSEAQPVEERVRYAQAAFKALLKRAGLTSSDVEGKRVLELGPGDNLGVAIKWLGAGARSVVGLDRFEVRAPLRIEAASYEALLNSLTPTERKNVGAAIRITNGQIALSERLRYVSGVSIEDASQLFEAESFDIIYSIAVLEHVYDPDAAFDALDRLLRPGGVMFHQIDFHDHGMFTQGGHHPWTFLQVPQGLYRAMTFHLGGPNRRLISYYRGILQEFGYEGRVVVSQVFGEGGLEKYVEHLVEGTHYKPETRVLLRRVRDSLQEPFRRMSEADLLPSGAFMTARKPTRLGSKP